MLNARGEVKDLCEIFRSTHKRHRRPVQENALPKLLQYAYPASAPATGYGRSFGGMSPKDEIRREGHFYPSQRENEPILKHMLVGLDVEPNPLEDVHAPPDGTGDSLRGRMAGGGTAKPAGMLSVPGKNDPTPFYSACTTFIPGPPVRLSCTSWDGYPPACCSRPNEEVQGNFRHFRNASYPKALHSPCWKENWKLISRHHRPAHLSEPDGSSAPDESRDGGNMVNGGHFLSGTGTQNGKHELHSIRHTGRTHQLRVHAAHPEGLNHPMVGDDLYGPAVRPSVSARRRAGVRTSGDWRKLHIVKRIDFNNKLQISSFLKNAFAFKKNT